ncbi:MAG: uracil-DNA glycosylase [Betaproteobacteria bacterium]
MPLPEAWAAALGPGARASLAQAEAHVSARESAGISVYPPASLRYQALEAVAPAQVRVVILGQDPYHRAGQAMGLAFAVPRGVRVPPSLVNILKEIEADVGAARPTHGDLTPWAAQGVLLLNTALSVEPGQAGSHARIGWAPVTSALVAFASARSPAAVFLLWGNHARATAPLVDPARHLVLEAAHPSPLSARNFHGCRHFSRANRFLAERNLGTVDWALPA